MIKGTLGLKKGSVPSKQDLETTLVHSIYGVHIVIPWGCCMVFTGAKMLSLAYTVRHANVRTYVCTLV